MLQNKTVNLRPSKSLSYYNYSSSHNILICCDQVTVELLPVSGGGVLRVVHRELKVASRVALYMPFDQAVHTYDFI